MSEPTPPEHPTETEAPVEPRRAPRPSSAQWHAGLLYDLRSIVDAHPRRVDDDDISAAPFWTLLGAVTPVPDLGPGWYRTRRLTSAETDRLDEAVLAPGGHPETRRFAVLEVRAGDADCLVRTQPGAPDDGLVLCLPRRNPVEVYRRLLRGLSTAEAVKPLQPFARGDLDRLPRQPDDAGVHTRAVAAAAAAGLTAVWAPPATGATTALVDALGRAIDAGQRCLLVSTDPLAVDAAALGLITARHPRPGQLVRVGPAHHPDLAARSDVGLGALAEAAQPELAAERDTATTRVRALRDAPELVALREARGRLSGFDADDYRAARQRLDDQADSEHTASELAAARDQTAERRSEDGEARQHLLEAAREVGRLRAEAADQRESRIRAELDGLPKGPRHWRLRRQLGADHTQATRVSSEQQDRLRALTGDDPASEVLDQTIGAGAAQPGAGADAASKALARALDRARPARVRAAEAAAALIAAESAERGLEARSGELGARPPVVDGDADACARAEQAGLPELAARLPELERAGSEAEERLVAAADELEAIQQRLTAGAAQVEPLILDRAAVTATTMAHLIGSRALASRRWDLVLIDRAACAPLPHVAFAAARATRGCLLVGDYLQTGPPRDPVYERGHYWDHDVFEHVGLLSARAAQHHPGCVLLDVQRRFGAEVTDLVNRIGYQGVLTGRPHPTAELIWVDTDGLPDGRVTEEPGARGGAGRNWPAGARVTRALAERHVARGQTVGVISPYPAQVRLTRALLDAGGPGLAGVPVGTASDLIGREFDVVVFDAVEDGQGWVARARRDAIGPDADLRRDALREVIVGLTRARHTSYLIAAGRALRGDRGTPLGELAQLCAEGRVPRTGARRALADDADRGRSPASAAAEVGGVEDEGDRPVVDA